MKPQAKVSKNLASQKRRTRVILVRPMESGQEKENKPSDRVLTPEQKPSFPVGTALTISVLTVLLLVASIYYGIIHP